MNNKFKGLYDTEKTTFITDKTEPINYYEPIIKTPKIQNHTYSINFNKTELYKEIEKLQQELQRKDNIINELKSTLETCIYGIEPKGCSINYNCEYDSEEDYICAMQEQSRLNTYKFVLDKIKELEEK